MEEKGRKSPRANKSKKQRAPWGGKVDVTSWGGRRKESANTASQPARMVYVAGWFRGVAESHVVGE